MEVQRINGEESVIRKIIYIFLTVSLIAAIAFIVPKILEQNKMEEGVEYLSKNDSEKAIIVFNEVLANNKDHAQAQSMLVQAKKMNLQQQTLKIDRAYKKGDMDQVIKIASKVLKTYGDDPAIGDLTDKVVYTQNKAKTHQ